MTSQDIIPLAVPAIGIGIVMFGIFGPAISSGLIVVIIGLGILIWGGRVAFQSLRNAHASRIPGPPLTRAEKALWVLIILTALNLMVTASPRDDHRFMSMHDGMFILDTKTGQVTPTAAAYTEWKQQNGK